MSISFRRITLIKSVLANFQIYFMSLYKCPMSIVNRIERLGRDFLCQGRDAKKNFHLVDWWSICQPKKNEGLGIRPLKIVNQALLGKWLSRIGEENNGLWRQIIMTKYKLERNGWDI